MRQLFNSHARAKPHTWRVRTHEQALEHALVSVARERGISVSAVISEALQSYLFGTY